MESQTLPKMVQVVNLHLTVRMLDSGPELPDEFGIEDRNRGQCPISGPPWPTLLAAW